MPHPTFAELGATLKYSPPDDKRAERHAVATRAMQALRRQALARGAKRQPLHRAWQEAVEQCHAALSEPIGPASADATAAMRSLVEVRMLGHRAIGGGDLGSASDYRAPLHDAFARLECAVHRAIATSA